MKISHLFCSLRLCLMLLLLETFGFALFAQKTTGMGRKSFTLVLDPGHGGKDGGACANGGKEKNINLQVALEVRRLINRDYPGVKVLMTREKDVFVGLQERARFANRNKADLFLSIHTNSAGRSAQGIETYVLGLRRANDNMRVAMRENQSILLEDDYSVKYQGFDPNSTESYIIFEMMQNVHLKQSIEVAQYVQNSFSTLGRINRSVRQDVFLVLRETAMPAILVELGFISNPSEAEFLLSDRGQKELAQCIARGFGKYFEKHAQDKQVVASSSREGRQVSSNEERTSDSATESVSATSLHTQVQAASGSFFSVQIASSTRKMSAKDAQFKGISDLRIVQENNRYYCLVGKCPNLTEAKRLRAQLKERYKDCYIVRYEGGKRIKEIY